MFFKKREIFLSPISGKLFNIEQARDPMFSQKMMGDGFVIQPIDGKLYAPMSGEITLVFPTKHAVGLLCEGQEILIHCGVDTVELEGKGFVAHIETGSKVKQGDLLLEMDLPYIEEQGKYTDIIVVFTSGEKVNCVRNGEEVKHGEEIIQLK